MDAFARKVVPWNDLTLGTNHLVVTRVTPRPRYRIPHQILCITNENRIGEADDKQEQIVEQLGRYVSEQELAAPT